MADSPGVQIEETAAADAGDSDDAPIGPGAEEEAFIATERGPAPSPQATAAPTQQQPREDAPAARLDDLVARIPEGTQKSLHDLLRARFTRVRRLRGGELR